MLIRKGEAFWEGNLKDGMGKVKFGGGAFEGPYSFTSRFENGKGTNPEEMIGAAHAGCFSMALSHELSQAGFTPKKVSTVAKVNMDKTDAGFTIVLIELETLAEVPKISKDEFDQIAAGAKKGCPVSRALASVEIKLNAKLVN